MEDRENSLGRKQTWGMDRGIHSALRDPVQLAAHNVNRHRNEDLGGTQ